MERIQELLNMLLAKEMLELKKMCFKHKHRGFLLEDVTIESKANVGNINGRYMWEDNKHLIIINQDNIDKYHKTNWSKRYYKRLIKETIRHELIHAFCKENYEDYSGIQGTHADYSPIFLSLLYFFKGVTNHKCNIAFNNSRIKQEIKDIKDYAKLEHYLMSYILEVDKLSRKLEDNSTKHIFSFSNKINGLVLTNTDVSVIKYRQDNKINKLYNGLYSWDIGCLAHPSGLKQAIEKKMHQPQEIKDSYYYISQRLKR